MSMVVPHPGSEQGPRQGVLHDLDTISAFEPQSPHSTNITDDTLNTLIFNGGLFDHLTSIKYPYKLAKTLPPNWRLAILNLSSSRSGWATTDLDADVAEIARAAAYFKQVRPHGKLVFMGHSTGCQDGMHYAVTAAMRPEKDLTRFDGIILQAPASDREAMTLDTTDEASASAVRAANSEAESMLKAGKGLDCLPLELSGVIFGTTPVTAKRWWSLASPDHRGQDDYFSSDLDDERLMASFGRMHAGSRLPPCIIYGANDEYVDKRVDKQALLQRWSEFVEKAGFDGRGLDDESLVPLDGSSHNLALDPPAVVQALCSRVNKYLEAVDA